MAGILIDASGAKLSECRTYRYALWRHWDFRGPENSVLFIGLNPSKADEVKNDTTISKCIGFAKKWQKSGVFMLNLYAFRATLPPDMVAASDPWGPENLDAFATYGSTAAIVVAAWGTIPTRYRPGIQWQSTISKTLRTINRPVHCLGKTQDGSPRHPSRLGYATERQLFWTPDNGYAP